MILTEWDNNLHQQQDYEEGHEELAICLVEADHIVKDGEEDGWLHNEKREIQQLEEKVEGLNSFLQLLLSRMFTNQTSLN